MKRKLSMPINIGQTSQYFIDIDTFDINVQLISLILHLNLNFVELYSIKALVYIHFYT